MSGKYKVFVKDGDYGYTDPGTYGVMDYVGEHDTFVDALKDFLDWNDGEDTKVSLTFKPHKEKKK